MKLLHLHDEYPRDGRQTLDPSMEIHAPTTTVGEIRHALKRLNSDDRTLPKDFASYIRRRIPSTRHLSELPHDVVIDHRGVPVGRA